MLSLRRSLVGTLLGALVSVTLGTGGACAQATPDDAALFQRLGGLPGISLVVSDFIDVFVQDAVILSNPEVRERKTPDTTPYIKFQVTSLMCEVTGGPCQYTGLDLREAHDGLNVSEEEWDRMVVLFSETLAAHEVPQRETEELFAILGPTKEEIVVPGSR